MYAHKKFRLSSIFERQAKYSKPIWNKGLRLLTALSRSSTQTGQEPHKGNEIAGSGASGRASWPPKTDKP